MPGITTEILAEEVSELKSNIHDIKGHLDVLKADVRQAALVDARYRRLAEEITPSNARLSKMVGKFAVAPGTFDDDEPCY